MLSRLFIAALWSADLLALIGDVYCIVVTFPCGTPVQVWYLIVSFHGICRLSYFQDQLSLNAGRKFAESILQ